MTMEAVPQQDPEVKEGTVTQWNARGFGFIQFSDGIRAYVHNSSCGGQHLVQGETVVATCVEDAKNPGKYAAQSVLRLVDGSGASLVDPQVNAAAGGDAGFDANRVEGVVSQWNERGFGFISLSDGKRAYVHNSECGGQHLTQGENVSAIIESDPTNPGKYCAKQVQRGSGPGGAAGVVADWKESGGYGFVNLDDGRRAYVHRSAMGGAGDLVVGTRVQVNLKSDPVNPGKWSVASLSYMSASQAFGGAPASVSAAQAFGGGPSGVPASVAFSSSPGVAQGVGTADGVVADWKEQGGYGFINLDDGRRAYVHRSNIGGIGFLDLVVGTRYRVNVQPDMRNPGKFSVSSIAGEADAPGVFQAAQPTQLPQQVQQAPQMQMQQSAGGDDWFESGTVSDWKDSGFGFVNLDDGRRVYVHRSVLGGVGSLVVGGRVEVTVKPDLRNPGKFCADTVLGDGVSYEPAAKMMRTA
mmetsp:Transcript_125584/g.217741  ORF Transcript_125584/g.217741 Transcript_125584/m.217741 type:complete len:468 (+) Transcript_125584:47-1450(+)